MNPDLAPDNTKRQPDSKLTGAVPGYKKSVLLVDSNPVTREARADSMRALGMTVNAVGTGVAARAKLDTAEFDLVLLESGSDVEGAEKLARSISGKNPRQLIGFLVGSPAYIVTSLDGKSVPRPARPAPKTPKAPEVFDFGQRVLREEKLGS